MAAFLDVQITCSGADKEKVGYHCDKYKCRSQPQGGGREDLKVGGRPSPLASPPGRRPPPPPNASLGDSPSLNPPWGERFWSRSSPPPRRSMKMVFESKLARPCSLSHPAPPSTWPGSLATHQKAAAT